MESPNDGGTPKKRREKPKAPTAYDGCVLKTCRYYFEGDSRWWLVVVQSNPQKARLSCGCAMARRCAGYQLVIGPQATYDVVGLEPETDGNPVWRVKNVEVEQELRPRVSRM